MKVKQNEITKQTFITGAEQLKNSIIFQMSLGNSELYHSNIWGWLIQKYSDVAKIFFKDIGEGLVVEREKNGNKDITIWDTINKKVYVIENKFKSLATNEQLKCYYEDLSGNNLNKKVREHQFDGDWKWGGGVYLGVLDNGAIELDEDIKDKWSYISYQTFTEKLLQISNNGLFKNKNDENKFHNIVTEYIANLQATQSVINYALQQSPNSKHKFDFQDSDILKYLEDVRLAEIYNKLKNQKFYRYLQSLDWTKFEPSINDFKFCKEEGYTSSGGPLINVFYKNEQYDEYGTTLKDYCGIGIQIQENTFRIFVDDSRYNNKFKDLYKQFNKCGWFDDNYNPSSKKLYQYSTRQRKKCNKFAPNFVYQYFDLSDKQIDFEYDKIATTIKTFLSKAREVIQNL